MKRKFHLNISLEESAMEHAIKTNIVVYFVWEEEEFDFSSPWIGLRLVNMYIGFILYVITISRLLCLEFSQRNGAATDWTDNSEKPKIANFSNNNNSHQH